MPDTRSHRGMHPEDPALFAPDAVPGLGRATDDLSLLLERGYAPLAATKLVGDRYALKQRQRAAISRAACAESVAASRHARAVSAADLRGQTLWIDGFNVVTTLEVALSQGIVLLCRDGVLRDIAGVHGSYRKVEETQPALGLIAAFVASLDVERCHFLLDRPVSNSGRLCAVIAQQAREHGWPFEADVVPDPDRVLEHTPEIVASADGVVLDRCARWFNLAYACVRQQLPAARIIDLSGA